MLARDSRMLSASMSVEIVSGRKPARISGVASRNENAAAFRAMPSDFASRAHGPISPGLSRFALLPSNMTME
jgi:hypothetical protein